MSGNNSHSLQGVYMLETILVVIILFAIFLGGISLYDIVKRKMDKSWLWYPILWFVVMLVTTMHLFVVWS